MEFIKKIIQFLKDVSSDERIPSRDKKVMLVLIGLIISPIDLIPDWIPILGVIDDIFLLALILDYFFEYVDSNILLSHYPFKMRSFLNLKRTSRVISSITPKWLRKLLWKYEPDIYR